MGSLLVCVAHTGAAIRLSATPSTRVADLQLALANLAGLACNDQILMHKGVKLDGLRLLATYKLPQVGQAAG
ncbi:hypothetical protein V8C86DRAFT_2548638 [Haematococcus lacustris]